MAEQILIIISGDASKLIAELTKGGTSVKKFGDETKKGEDSTGKFSQGIMSVNKAAAALGLAGLVTTVGAFVAESYKAAAAAERLGNATSNLAKGIGETGDSMVDAITRASNATISRTSAMEAANKAMMFGIVQNSDEMKRLTEIAVALGASMGQSATKSLDDLTVALSRNSPLILDNLGISLKLSDAYKIYADSIGVSVEALTDEQKALAFRSAALSEGEKKLQELGGVTVDNAAKSEQLTAAWSDFSVAFGGLMSQMSGGIGTATSFVRKLEEGAIAWQGIFKSISEVSAATEENTGITAEAMAEYQKMNQAGQLSDEILAHLTRRYNEQQQALVQTTGAHAQNATQLAAETAATQAAAAAQAELENRQRAQSAESERWAGIAEANVQTLDELAQGHLMTAQEAENYAEAQKVAIEAEAERQAMMQGLAQTSASYFLSLQDMQNQAVQSEASYHASVATMRADANADIEAKETELTDKLTELEQQRQEKIQWVLSGAHDRTQEENDAALAFWNAHYDQLVADTETSYGEQTAAMQAAFDEQEAAASAAHAKEQAEYEKHLEDLKLKTALGVLETTGQLQQLTGGLATSAGDALALIQAGIIPVTQQMGTAIQTSLGELATASEAASTTAASNQEILQQALTGTLEPATALKTELAGIGADGAGGIDTTIASMANLTTTATDTQAAVGLLNTTLAGLGGGGGDLGGEGGDTGGGDSAGEGGGGGLSSLVTQSETLNALFAETLPASMATLGEAHTTFTETALEEETALLEALTATDLLWVKTGSETIPGMHAAGTQMLTDLDTQFKKVGDTSQSSFNRAKDALHEIPNEIQEINRFLSDLIALANSAANALRSMRGGANQAGFGGGRAVGGPVQAGQAYVVGEAGPELFFPGQSGSIVPNGQINFGGEMGAATDGGGNTQQLIIQNVNIVESSNPQRTWQLIKQEAERQGFKFSRN